MFSLLLLAVSLGMSQAPQSRPIPADMFKDVLKTDGLYQDELKLHWNGGDLPLRDDTGYFRTHVMCTRYEYAVFVDRALADLADWHAHFPAQPAPLVRKSAFSSYIVRWQAQPVKDPAALLSVVHELRPELKTMGRDSDADEALVRSLITDDKPVTLTRTYKKGDVARYKAQSDVTVDAGGAQVVGTSKTTVKEVKPDGSVVFEELEEGSTLTLNGQDRDIPGGSITTTTRDKSGKLLDMKAPDTLLSRQSPEMTRLLAEMGMPILPEKAVKPGDSWETVVDNPAVKDKKVTIKTSYVGTDTLDGKTYWKVRQTAEPDTDTVGAKMAFDATFWLDPANGQEERSEFNLKGLPSNYGLLTIKTKSSRFKADAKQTPQQLQTR